jgi:two-component system sensor histidine kinase QseC
MTTITPFLWFDDNAEDAIELYTGLFRDSRVLSKTQYPDGPLMSATIEIAGQRVMVLNAGPKFKPTEAFSFFVTCADQAEVDTYWDALIAGGGSPSQCGWLKDRFGYSWQIIPDIFMTYASDPDGAKVGRVMGAMLQMTKFDVAALTAAYEG